MHWFSLRPFTESHRDDVEAGTGTMNVYQPLNAKQNPDSEKSYQQTCPTITPEEDVIIIFIIRVRNQICPILRGRPYLYLLRTLVI